MSRQALAAGDAAVSQDNGRQSDDEAPRSNLQAASEAEQRPAAAGAPAADAAAKASSGSSDDDVPLVQPANRHSVLGALQVML